MNTLEKLYDIAHKSGINIIDAHFSDTKKAACMTSGMFENKNIVIDKAQIDSYVEEVIILAEEVGHYETLGVYMILATKTMSIARCNRLKYEAWAKRWSVREILPPEEIQEALNCGCHNDCEMAEYCNVTPDFVRYAFQYYSQKRVKFKYRWYT